MSAHLAPKAIGIKIYFWYEHHTAVTKLIFQFIGFEITIGVWMAVKDQSRYLNNRFNWLTI